MTLSSVTNHTNSKFPSRSSVPQQYSVRFSCVESKAKDSGNVRYTGEVMFGSAIGMSALGLRTLLQSGFGARDSAA